MLKKLRPDEFVFQQNQGINPNQTPVSKKYVFLEIRVKFYQQINGTA